MKTRPTKTKATSINFSLTFTKANGKHVQTGITPSPACPDIKAMLELLIFSINEECGTKFHLFDEKKALKELGYG